MKHKLLDETTRENIYKEYITTDMSYDQLAKKYNVSCKTIYNTCRRYRDAAKNNSGKQPNSRTRTTSGMTITGGGNINTAKRPVNKQKKNILDNYVNDAMRNRDSVTGEKRIFDNDMPVPIYSPYSAQNNTSSPSYFSIPSSQIDNAMSMEQLNSNIALYNNSVNVSDASTNDTNGTKKTKKKILNLLQQDIALHMSNDI